MFAQSNLPACKGSDASRWSNCVGSNTFASGNKYVGEQKGGKLNGQGIFTFLLAADMLVSSRMANVMG